MVAALLLAACGGSRQEAPSGVTTFTSTSSIAVSELTSTPTSTTIEAATTVAPVTTADDSSLSEGHSTDDPAIPQDLPPGTLAAVADSIHGATRYRMAYYLTFWGGPDLHVAGNRVYPLATIDIDSDLKHVVVDFSALWAAYPDTPPGFEERADEMIFEAYTDGEVSFLRAPFAAPFDDLGLGNSLPAAFRELVDRWGVVRPDTSDDVLGVAGTILPGRPGGFLSVGGLDRLLSSAYEVKDDHRAFVQGELVNQAEGMLTFADLVEVTGPRFVKMLEEMSLRMAETLPGVTDQLSPRAQGEVVAALDQFDAELLRLPVRLTLAYDQETRLNLVEVYVDGTLPMRRLIRRAAIAAGGDPDALEAGSIVAKAEMKFDLRVELYDYDSSDIDVVLPEPVDAVDITDVPLGYLILG